MIIKSHNLSMNSGENRVYFTAMLTAVCAFVNVIQNELHEIIDCFVDFLEMHVVLTGSVISCSIYLSCVIVMYI